ncbi:hypothetical protein EXIGLDRAFT_736399 [Exidia glandulosa HHB12029]|uniref:F-box domain-containing protein n=1 Tax=Exidia glandulosa HHB12029 TaxID=1314781 RepID=A0A165JGH7_EXIGL|nr:hypothetical protein EXIGLDRAFT_736399 [Exidia glandulosa HHB12029]
MRNDVRWVGQSLAIASRAIYSWVAPILLETVYISTTAKVLPFYMFTDNAPECLQHMRRFIVHDHADWLHLPWDDNPGFLSACPARLCTFSGRHTVLQTLVESPNFHPGTIFLVGKLTEFDYDAGRAGPELQGAFSRLTRLCLLDLHIIPGGVTVATLFPELTHLLVLSFESYQLSALDVVLSLPKLQRVLVSWDSDLHPVRDQLFDKLPQLQDERIYYVPYKELIPSPSTPLPTVADVARRERDGADVWNFGFCISTQSHISK